jgi:hypothetical protein
VSRSIVSSRRQAILAGERDGADDVHCRATDPDFGFDATDPEGYDTAAINAGVASMQGVPRRWERVYYAAYDRGARAACRRYTWRLEEEGHEYAIVSALDLEEAIDIARGNVDRGNYCDGGGGETLYIHVRARNVATGESDSARVACEPDEPACADDDHERVWTDERVSGHGGGVIITEVCAHCGARRTIDTWAQDRQTGEQGLRSVSYEVAS